MISATALSPSAVLASEKVVQEIVAFRLAVWKCEKLTVEGLGDSGFFETWVSISLIRLEKQSFA